MNAFPRRALVRPAGSGGVAAVEWVQVTAAMVAAATKYTGSADTTKSCAVTAGRLGVVANTIAATADGIRETSGYAIPLLTALPGFDADAHDLGVYLHDVQTSSLTMGLAIALVTSPGASAIGTGILVTDVVRAHPQSQTATIAASTFSGDALLRVNIPGADASAVVAGIVERIVGGVRHHQGANNATMNLTDLSAVSLYVQAASYSGAQSDNATADAEVYIAAVPKLSLPEVA